MSARWGLLEELELEYELKHVAVFRGGQFQPASVGPMFGQLNHFQLLGRQAEPYVDARYRGQTERLSHILDERLSTRQWLAGTRYSIADIATYSWALYLEQHGFDPEQHIHLVRWRDEIGQRPAVARSWQRFDEAFSKVSTDSRRAAMAADLDHFFGRDENAPEVDFSAVTRA